LALSGEASGDWRDINLKGSGRLTPAGIVTAGMRGL
jgi:hypothetical protein